MSPTACLAIACDADPDVNPVFRQLPPGADPLSLWQGLAVGVGVLRQELLRSPFCARYGQLPITWLLRCDRQIAELMGDPAYCFRRFEALWRTELEQHASEIGWHPHLYRWDKSTRAWTAYLGKDDDLEILDACLRALRGVADVRAVRTGWDYHSNRLLHFFSQAGLAVDASAIPGSLQGNGWAHDWRGAPRIPYLPSRADYRRPAALPRNALDIVMLPVLVRRLPLPHHLVRFCWRGLRRTTKSFDWESARWQGMIITRHVSPFRQAVRQTFAQVPPGQMVFLTSYFHAGDLLSPPMINCLLRNLQTIVSEAERGGYDLAPVTLCRAATLARPAVL